jgi:hypothetical protein
MAKIHCPNKQYSGVSAGVTFVNGVGETTDPYLISWFKSHGYDVEQVETSIPEDNVTIEDNINTDGQAAESSEDVNDGNKGENAPKKRNSRKTAEKVIENEMV